MKVYIAGKITGDPDYRAKFKRAEDQLREEGHTVINPAVLPSGMDRADYGRICAAMLDSADAVCFLGDFGESRGAKVEYDYCQYTEKKIIHLHEEDERAVTFWTPTPKPGVYKRTIQINISKPDGGKPKPEYLKKVIEEAQKEMAAKCRKEVIDQLKSLRTEAEYMQESDEIFVRDREALDVAIDVLSGTYRDDGSQKIVTNADHIRAMNDDELAKWLCGISTCYFSCPGRNLCEYGKNGMEKWLKLPYKTED